MIILGHHTPAIQCKKCAQIFVSSVNKNPIRYTIRDATNSYTVNVNMVKKCAQIFVSSVNKTLSDIQFVTLRTAIRYNVNMVSASQMEIMKQCKQSFPTIDDATIYTDFIDSS